MLCKVLNVALRRQWDDDERLEIGPEVGVGRA